MVGAESRVFVTLTIATATHFTKTIKGPDGAGLNHSMMACRFCTYVYSQSWPAGDKTVADTVADVDARRLYAHQRQKHPTAMRRAGKPRMLHVIQNGQRVSRAHWEGVKWQ